MSRDEAILKCIQDIYRSPSEPNFSFVTDSIKSRPYEQVIRELGQTFSIQEDTDPNVDVSFGYVLAAEGRKWVLRLSMLGPYAIVLRVPEPERVELVSSSTPPVSDSESKLIAMLSKHKIEHLGCDVLLEPVPLELFNTRRDNVKIYQALFTDTDHVPC